MPLTLAEPPPPPQQPVAPAGPMVGTSAKWVPDNPDPAFQLVNQPPPAQQPYSPAPTTQPPVAPQQPGMPSAPPGFPPAAQQAPPVYQQQPVQQPPMAAPPVQQHTPQPVPTPGDDLSASNFRFDDLDAAPTAAVADGTAPTATDGEPGSTQGQPKESVASRVRRRRKRGKGPIVVGIGTALMVICVVGLWMQQKKQQEIDAANKAAAEVPQVNQDWEDAKVELASANVAAKELSPTSGDPIPLDYMPIQPQLLCHLRPADIWAQDARSQEFIALVADLGTWLGGTLDGGGNKVPGIIEEITRFAPQEIEEVTFGINFGSRTSDPQICGVVRVKNMPPLSELQRDRFRGELRTDLKEDVYQASDFAYMQVEPKAFVFAPAILANELPDAKTFPANAAIELETLVKQSDRTRPASLLLDVANIDTHRQFVLGESLHTISDHFVLWFGEEVSTVSWSYHLSAGEFYMETLVRPVNDSTPLKVQRHLKLQLSRLPQLLMDATAFMQPGIAGYRKLIGRFPAMVKALDLGTSTHIGDNLVRMVTLLPAKAGPNLAAASMMAWRQSLETDFSGPAPVVAKGPKLPDTVAERLKMTVIVDFRRMPLQEAFGYVADEIKTPLSINGDALKLAGMTQNMPQTYDLGEVSALKAIDAMVSNPDYKGMLVIVVDEASKSIQLTTRTVAESSGLTIYDTKQ